MRRILLPLGALAVLPLFAHFTPIPGAFVHGSGPRAAVRAALDSGSTGPFPGESRDLAELFPANSLLYVEAPGLDALLHQGLDGPFLSALLRSPLGSGLLAASGSSATGWLQRLEEEWGREPLSTLAALTDRGAALALRPRPRDKAATTLILRTSDAGVLAAVLDDAFGRIEDQYGIPGAFDEPADRILGADVWTLGDDLVVARRGGLLILGNDADFARTSLELAAMESTDGETLAAKPAFRSLAQERAADATLWAFADLPGLVEAGAHDLADLTQLAGVPASQSLLGTALSGLPSGSAVALWLTARAGTLELGAQGFGANLPGVLLAQRDAFTPPPAIADPADLANGLVYRDFAAFVNERTELFAPELLPSFTESLSTLSLFFGGADFGEDILPGLSPWIRLVSRDVTYRPGVTPENPLPALCAVAELRDSERLGPEVITAFQTLIGIINADQAQKRGGMMRLRLGLEGDVELTSASFLPPGPEDGVDMRYNLEPACAMVGPYLVLGTHEGLVREVIRRLETRTGRSQTAPSGEFLTLSGPALLRVVEANFETLVMNKVLDEGMTTEEAEEDLGGLKLLLASIESARFETRAGTPAAGRPSARVTLTLAETRETR